MLESFAIKEENGEEVLYCYMNYDYEFSKEFFSNLKEVGFVKQVQNWIQKNKITFHGKKVVVVASGIVIASLLLNEVPIQQKSDVFSFTSPAIVEQVGDISSFDSIKDISSNESIVSEETPIIEENIPVEDTTDISSSFESPQVSSTPTQEIIPNEIPSPVETEPVIQTPVFSNPITIYRNGVPVVLEFEEYIAGVVAAEMPASFSSSALQAQAVLARTYALKRVEEGKHLTDTVDTQVYYDESHLRKEWGSSFDFYWNKVKEACQSTEGKTLQYQGCYIDAVYHSTSNGKTEAARNVWGYEVPYLQSVDSHWDYNTTFYHNTISKDMNQLLHLFGVTDLQDGDIEILSRNESGRVAEVRIQNQIYQGVDLRSILGLRSSDFDISMENGNLVITTRGWGHGVGMSQYGAEGMAKEGYSYQQILSHYYPGTTTS